MDLETTMFRIQRVFRDVLEDDALVLSEETTADQVDGWDSVSSIMLMVALEAEFGIRFNTGEMASLANVGQLVERIDARRSGSP